MTTIILIIQAMIAIIGASAETKKKPNIPLSFSNLNIFGRSIIILIICLFIAGIVSKKIENNKNEKINIQLNTEKGILLSKINKLENKINKLENNLIFQKVSHYNDIIDNRIENIRNDENYIRLLIDSLKKGNPYDAMNQLLNIGKPALKILSEKKNQTISNVTFVEKMINENIISKLNTGTLIPDLISRIDIDISDKETFYLTTILMAITQNLHYEQSIKVSKFITHYISTRKPENIKREKSIMNTILEIIGTPAIKYIIPHINSESESTRNSFEFIVQLITKRYDVDNPDLIAELAKALMQRHSGRAMMALKNINSKDSMEIYNKHIHKYPGLIDSKK